MKNTWTEYEINILKIYFGKILWIDLLIKLPHHTKSAITMKAKRLNIQNNLLPIEAFLLKVNKKSGKFWNNTECWEWIGNLDKKGYGIFNFDYKRIKAHRFIYNTLKKNLSRYQQIHHLCLNKKCVNINHLKAMSHKKHIEIHKHNYGSKNRNKTHCPKGHIYNIENTYYNKQGHRKCKTCVNLCCYNRYHNKE